MRGTDKSAIYSNQKMMKLNGNTRMILIRVFITFFSNLKNCVCFFEFLYFKVENCFHVNLYLFCSIPDVKHYHVYLASRRPSFENFDFLTDCINFYIFFILFTFIRAKNISLSYFMINFYLFIFLSFHFFEKIFPRVKTNSTEKVDNSIKQESNCCCLISAINHKQVKNI